MRQLLVLAATACAACSPVDRATTSRACAVEAIADVALPGGRFLMGADPLLPEEGPPHEATVAPFRIDRAEVTNAEFRAFVRATGYVTLAERAPDPRLYPGRPDASLKPSSVVFIGPLKDPARPDPERWWRVVDGADWRHPEGPGSSIAGRDKEPVVQVGYEDALAYAHWRGRDLPTEAEWEYAARGGVEGARFVWGDKLEPAEKPRANVWQGAFPIQDEGEDGYRMRRAPVGCFPPNGYGLFDMAGNVWEWTKDQAGDTHVIKGGSYLCADSFCFRYRPSARQPGPPDTGASHIGFRTVLRPHPA